MTLAAQLRRIPAVAWVLILGVTLIAAIVLFKPNPQPRAPKPIAQTQVKVVLAQPQTMAVNVNAQGSVEPRRQIDVVSQVAGSLVQVSEQFASGGFFAKGATLVQIDPRDYEIALVRAKAALLDAEKTLATERGQAQQAQRQWQELGSKDANDLFLRKPQLAAAEAQVEAARAGVQQAQLNLARTRIQLPFAARVNTTWVDLGQYVSTGTRIATVYDSAAALVRLPLTDLQASLINLPLAFGKPQQELPDVILRGVVAGNAYEWKGKITRTEASLDPQSRMFYAVVEIPDPFDPFKNAVPLLMGMYVKAEIIGKPIANVMLLPKSVIFRRDQVYSLDADNRVQIHSVNILRSDEQQVWFTGDIKPEQAIVLERQGYLAAGIQVVPEVVTNLAAEDAQP
ncbi:efflux RND transporter periplasmic adaptor subunit [Cellvibrio sp. OA-2007]|uniref:efflux RND transporter periplasmic adaptor subunit n=1 Tax=Cellvibrio sp. OA-2007 TaxID=529823 RepID=UPI000781A134|nr:efflux RND transporter periplasmic adaptor subunit [Cellvibrio sp. OA-2007]